MARRSISIDEKIAQQKQLVFQAKDKYEAAVAELDKLMKKRDELRSKELLAAFATSNKSFDEVMKNCQVGEPVFLTKNGRGRFVVLDIEDYERERAEKKLLKKLQEAEEAVKDGEGWLSLDELKSVMGE